MSRTCLFAEDRAAASSRTALNGFELAKLASQQSQPGVLESLSLLGTMKLLLAGLHDAGLTARKRVSS